MVQVDLITGFLGAGKTTFLRRYVRYLVQQGHKVCILENDFGAVNVDAMLVQEVLGPGCDVETISGGCDCDTHQRRMRTKLIAMAMRGFDRVVVEPSGIFDVDEFFDILRDDPLDRWYQLGSVIAIVDALLPETLSPQAEYLLASETMNAGCVLLSRAQLAAPAQCAAAAAHLERALETAKSSRRFAPGEILAKDWDALTDADLAALAAADIFVLIAQNIIRITGLFTLGCLGLDSVSQNRTVDLLQMENRMLHQNRLGIEKGLLQRLFQRSPVSTLGNADAGAQIVGLDDHRIPDLLFQLIHHTFRISLVVAGKAPLPF